MKGVSLPNWGNRVSGNGQPFKNGNGTVQSSFCHPLWIGKVSPTKLLHAGSIHGRVGEPRRRQLSQPGVVFIMTIERATSTQQIDALLGVRSEDEHLEFKAAENRYDFEELVDYCVALANEGGGRMILGVTDKAPRRVVGTKAFDVPERTVAGIYERLELKVTCDEVAHPGGRALVFHVPSRPRGQPVHYKGKYLMRAGEDIVPMSPDQLRAIFAEGQPDWLCQAALTGCDDDRVGQLLVTQAYFVLLTLA